MLDTHLVILLDKHIYSIDICICYSIQTTSSYEFKNYTFGKSILYNSNTSYFRSYEPRNNCINNDM